MGSSDIILFLLIIACIAFFVYRRRKKQAAKPTGIPSLPNIPTNYDNNAPLNYMALRHTSSVPALHGVSIYIFKISDSLPSETGINGCINGCTDGSPSTGFTDSIPYYSDTDSELQVTDAITALTKDGYSPSLNTLINNNLLVFYITY
jgi:hypothetical protein